MKKKHLKVLQEIHESIPKDLLENLINKEPIGSTIKEIMQRGMLEPDDVVSLEEKARFQAMIDSGYLDRDMEVADASIEQKISDILDAGIKLAVDEGRLPKRAPKLALTNNKGKQYARRQAKRLKTLLNPESGEGQGAEEDAGEHIRADSARGTDE